MSRTNTLGQAESRALLEARARDLARPAAALTGDQEEAGSDAIAVLEIRLGNERVGIPLAEIVEVYRPSAMSAVPGAQAPVAGVTAWRGRVLTVLDLAHARGSVLALGDTVRLVVLGVGRAAFGLLADEVEVVRVVAAGDLLPADDPSPARAGIVRGVTHDALVVLDVAALLQRYTTAT